MFSETILFIIIRKSKDIRVLHASYLYRLFPKKFSRGARRICPKSPFRDVFTFNRKRAQASNRYSPCPQRQYIPLVSTGTSHRVILPVDMSLATAEPGHDREELQHPKMDR